MKKTKLYLLAILLLSGCYSESEQFCGTYNGILPAASNPGVETTINFEDNKTFQSKLVYIDVNDGVFYERGTYKINGDILTTRSADEKPQFYKIEKEQIRRLDNEQKEITGSLADNYILKQTKNCND